MDLLEPESERERERERSESMREGWREGWREGGKNRDHFLYVHLYLYYTDYGIGVHDMYHYP